MQLVSFTKIALTFLFLSQCLVGCTTSKAGSDKLLQSFNDNSLLWKVTAPSGAESYVFGTIHVADTGVFRQRDTVLKLLDNCSSFWAELHLDSASGMGDLTTMASKFLLPDGQTLSDFFTASQMKLVRKAIREKLGPMGTIAESLKPGALVVLLTLDSLPSTAPMSIDEFLWKRAKNRHKKRYGIERIDEQLAVLDSIPPSVLIEALESPGESRAMINELLTAYAQEDLGHIVMLVDSLTGLESYMLKINDERNLRMAARLQQTLSNGGAFIAIGSAHLGGKQGLLAVLSKQGYAVTPVFGSPRVQWLNK